MTATLPAPADLLGVQLVLDLWSPRPRRRTAVARPYWDDVHLVDHGGALLARRPGVRAVLGAERRADGSWVGSHDLFLLGDGSSSATRPQSTRADALACAAYDLARYCQRVIAAAPHESVPTVRAARRLLGWLDHLGLM